MALSNAERQQRYRQRRRAGEAKVVYRAPKGSGSRRERLKRGTDLLIDLRDEYQAWREAMPDALENTATVERLDAIIDALDAAELEDMQALELPLGYGRDR